MWELKSQNGQWDIFEISSGANDCLPNKRSGEFPGLPPLETRKTFTDAHPASSCHKDLPATIYKMLLGQKNIFNNV